VQEALLALKNHLNSIDDYAVNCITALLLVITATGEFHAYTY